MVHIKDGQVVESTYRVHFPIPTRHAWNNVIYTCSTMLLFESEQQINTWRQRHRIAKGDVQPIAIVWEFAKVWYGNHLSPTQVVALHSTLSRTAAKVSLNDRGRDHLALVDAYQ